MNKPLIIAHQNCPDGCCAAMIAERFFKTHEDREADIMFASYGNPRHSDSKFEDYKFPDLTGRDVYIVDFSYPRNILKEMAKIANFITVLDHHKTAQKDLEGLQDEINAESGSSTHFSYIHFNMDKSGAMLTWEYFHGEDSDAPLLVKYVQDRDLWHWKLPSSREISAALSSYDLTVEVYEKLLTKTFEDLYDDGVAILRSQDKEIKILMEGNVSMGWFGDYYVPICNNTVMSLTSELGNRMAKDNKFAVVFTQRKDGSFYYSLRSIMGEGLPGIDVSEVAKKYGGGGHKCASGITTKECLHKHVSQ